MRLTDYIAKRLAEARISKTFLVQGAANNDLIYSIADTPGIDYVCAQHEQAAGFMAEGWAKVSGKTGCAIATSGPGGQNLVTPIANCFYDSVPCLFITGQVGSAFMRPSSAVRQRGFQEWPAHESVRQITKYAVRVDSPEKAVEAFETALAVCSDGRPGPALIDIPVDVQRAELTNDVFAKVQLYRRTKEIASADVLADSQNNLCELMDDLSRAKRPLLLIGGGVRSFRARQALLLLASMMRCPIVPTWNALDVVPSNFPGYAGRIGTYGGAGRNFVIQNCDLLIAVGCRLSGRILGGRPETFARGARRYVVDVDPGLLEPKNQERQANGIFMDAAEFLEWLERVVRNGYIDRKLDPANWTGWSGIADLWRRKYDPVTPEHYLPGQPNFYAFARELSEVADRNAVVVYDCGGNAVVMNHAFETKLGQRYFSNNGNSPMGFSMAAAIGAWFADPARQVICVIGDGGFQLNIQELQTIAKYGAAIKVFILNNSCYGITKAFQDAHYKGRHEASGPEGYSVPDLAEICRSYGLKVSILANNSDHRLFASFVLDQPGAHIGIVESPDFHSYWPAIKGWATPIEDMSPLLPRSEFKENMIVDPLPGWETGEYK